MSLVKIQPVHLIRFGPAQTELGFGLGLELTERLVGQQGWGYSNRETGAGRHVVIEFDVK